MTQATVDSVVQRAAVDAAFRQQLSSQADSALAPYREQLSAEELALLRSLAPSLARLNPAAAPPPASPWRPASFKELGAATLSLALIFLLLYSALQTFGLVSTAPTVLQVGDSVQLIDPFERAQEALNIFFPLFSAVVTFWLGIAVEGRRADQAQQQAEAAQAGQQEAQADAAETRIDAEVGLANVEAAVKRNLLPAGIGALESTGGREIGVAEPAGDEILAAIDAARVRLRR